MSAFFDCVSKPPRTGAHHPVRIPDPRPKIPWHNGKAERSRRNDRERFYTHLKFCSYEALQLQIKRHLRRSNRILMSVLGRKSPIQKRREPEAARFF